MWPISFGTAWRRSHGRGAFRASPTRPHPCEAGRGHIRLVQETITLTISAASGATSADAAGTATVLNDDGAAYLAVDSIWGTEGDSGTAAATVSRWGNTTRSSTVKKTASGTAQEKNEVVNLVLSGAVGATISDASGAVTIVNDD